MKHLIWLLIITPTMAQALPVEDFNVILQAQWQDLEHNAPKAKDFGGKWILAGSITFKKKVKDTVHLSKLYLQWQGKSIENLVASLYRKNNEDKFMPIQENLICDGQWNKTQQTLLLNFDKRETLGPVNTYYLVLTVPDVLEPTLKKGSFDVMVASLPEPFKDCAHYNSLSLAFNTQKKSSFHTAIRIAKR